MDDADIEIRGSLLEHQYQQQIQTRDSPQSEDHEEKDQVKSKAIVRFLKVQSAAPFARLKCNTDLNMPPSNWLSNSANSYGLGQFLSHHSGFSSFRMANMFPDCVGGVDVVSDAENIKRLLKLPYSRKSVISMMVHRIENTLLIDEFDVAKYLLRQNESEWHWLRTFVYENILKSLNENEKKLSIHPKSREALAHKYLTSKFLYYSLKAEQENQEEAGTETFPEPFDDDHCQQFKPLPPAGPVLPEPDEEENCPDPRQAKHIFNRNVVWTFEDIRMLIGTDMPIFGGANRPCISLRLRDESKPINVLTGIDYWLDNLMCNVPEVVMCYHLDGIVQRYELIKTEDLPYLEDSKFSPKVIRNVAQNILAFLKANATKAGHTYWLFKAKNDDVVKLYDLTTLCKNNEPQEPVETNDTTNEDESNQNPFTIPVAMLLYTVARNMKNSTEGISATKAGAIKTLLDNCIKLLPKERYPQIVTSSHYILSDLHIPAETDPGSPKFNSTLDEDEDESQSLFGDGQTTSASPQPEEYVESDKTSDRLEAAIKSIEETLQEYSGSDGWRYNSRPPPLLGETNERCEIALQHIADGLSCLQYFDSSEEQKNREKEKAEEKRQIYHEETHPNMAKSEDPIPLPYSPINPEPKMANPSETIPMIWKSTSEKQEMVNGTTKKGAKKKNKRKNEKKDVPSVDPSNEVDTRSLLLKGQIGVIKSWNVHLKILLFEKACLIYATLAEVYYAQESFGTSLRYIYAALRCQQVVTKYISCVSSQRSLLLGRIGDCFFQLAKKWDNIQQYLKEFEEENRVDQLIHEELVKDIGCDVEQTLPLPSDNIEQLMVTSCNCYETAIACATKDAKDELIRRLGSVRNELGVKYMHWAQEEFQKFWELSADERQKLEDIATEQKCKFEPLYQVLAMKSYDSLQKGVGLFESVNDPTNLAFLLCNMGRFMRFRAHIYLIGESPNNIQVQKKFYYDAFAHYQRALGVLGSRKKNPDLWSLVTWELSTATFNLAKQLQDYNNVENEGTQSVQEVEQEVIEMLQKALKLCDQELNGPRQVLYSFRAALIHHRIASYYHFSFRSLSEESRRKTVLQLCKLHYEKAVKIFENLSEPQEFLQIQMERVALQEYQCELAQTIPAKMRQLQQALDLCKQSRPMIEHLSMTKSSTTNSNVNCNDIQKLLELFEKRLQVILRTLAKLCLLSSGNSGSKKEESDRLASHYKNLFAVTLQKRPASTAEDVTGNGGTSSNHSIKEYALHVMNLLQKVCDLDKCNG
ncbi:erythroid differentiation-related factor 1-like [Uranotaenia lowii]|uniref:erythroid differentiation-related factor 1-like n=1 Tax=Uranotaenia lowii TaxID=190385 RepID=UPI002478642F|nr:erythroid differentiation-related factor 1-like [Uranotaenia lowii]XP_055603524.1 erythroid differentiation-related factor 1-like [Uranotaenia lowii]